MIENMELTDEEIRLLEVLMNEYFENIEIGRDLEYLDYIKHMPIPYEVEICFLHRIGIMH